MIFLQPTDIELSISEYSLDQLSTNVNVLNYSELVAIEETKSYLTSRYDVDFDFRPITTYNNLLTYNLDDRVTVGDKIYISLTASNTGSPTASATWVQKDDRPTALVLAVLDIMIYHLISSVDFSSVSEFRHKRYLDTCKKLKDYTKGTTTLIGATLRKKNQGNSIAWGSKYNDNFDLNGINTTSRESLSVDIYNNNLDRLNNKFI